MEKGTKIALIVGGVLLVCGGIAYYFIRKNKKEGDVPQEKDRSKLASVFEKANSKISPDSSERAKKLIDNLNKFQLTPDTISGNYISEMKNMGYTIQYSPKKSYWSFTPSSLVNESRVKNGIEIKK